MGGLFSLMGARADVSRCSGSSDGQSNKRRRLSPSCNEVSPRLIPCLPDELSIQILARVPRIYYYNAKLVSRSWRAATMSPELYNLRKEFKTTEEWLYILAKVDSSELLWYALDPSSKAWLKLPPMPSSILHPLLFTQVCGPPGMMKRVSEQLKIGLKTRCRAYSRILGIQRECFTSSDLGSLREVSDLSASSLLKALREASVTDHQEKDKMHFCNGLQSKLGKSEGFLSIQRVQLASTVAPVSKEMNYEERLLRVGRVETGKERNFKGELSRNIHICFRMLDMGGCFPCFGSSNKERSSVNQVVKKDSGKKGSIVQAHHPGKYYNVLHYDGKMVNGFYDVCATTSLSMLHGKMPVLADLQAITNLDAVDYEVILVNREIDPQLRSLENKACSVSAECGVLGDGLGFNGLMQKIADIVVARMGGPIGNAEEMTKRWRLRSDKLMSSLRTAVFPLGLLNVGLSRHRALLFKVLN